MSSRVNCTPRSVGARSRCGPAGQRSAADDPRWVRDTSAGRAEAFSQIDAVAAADPVFCAGVEAAPAFKRLREQPYEFDGVPEGSPVRRFA
jgi:hypothetical protein